MRRRIQLATGLALLALLALFASPAQAVRKVENYPKVALYTSQVGAMTDASIDTLSWYDLVLSPESPWNVGRIRAKNSDIKLFFPWMPQNIVKWSEGQTYWYPDTTWSPIRLAQFYADRNDWYLRDVHGNRIPEWFGYAANWTKYCPKGTYGTSKGKTYVEWIIEVVLPRITKGGGDWQPWGPESTAYNGLMFEVLVDCLGSFDWRTYQYADPDRDGIAEGVFAPCSGGGWDDSLSVLYREQNDYFHEHLYEAVPDDLPVCINGANKFINPEWWTDLSGMKLESWMSWPNPPFQDWWDHFYGFKDPGNSVEWGPGYQWTEQNLHHSGDESEGWDNTILQVWDRTGWTPTQFARMKRFGLGTTLLGDGYFCLTKENTGLLWQSEYEWDLGAPLDDFEKEVHIIGAARDTLYVRRFAKGSVEVNPYQFQVNGVTPQDARFGFWQPVSNLTVERDGTSATLHWTAPGSIQFPVESMELRYHTSPITPDNWEDATPFAGNPLTGGAGSSMQVTVPGLEGGHTWFFRLRNRVNTRLEPEGSNQVSVFVPGTPPVPDEVPPAAIQNLAALSVEENRVRLVWTAPGDDGNSGRATSYLARRRTGAAITSESEWSAATPIVSGVPTPATAGAAEAFWVTGLSPSTSYGFAVRAVDEAGNVGGLSNPLTAHTQDDSPPPPPPPPDTAPPDTVSDLSATAAGPDWIDLRWTAPGDDDRTGRATTYLIRRRTGSGFTSEGQWTSGTSGANPPSPGNAGEQETYRFTGLAPNTTYGFAVRAADEAGNLSALPPVFVATTAGPANPDDTTPPAQITDLSVVGAGQDWIQLRWTATGDDGQSGRATRFLARALVGRAIVTEAQWSSGAAPPDPVPVPGASGTVHTFRWTGLQVDQLYGFAIRAEDEVPNRGAISPALTARTAAPPPDEPPAAVADLAVLKADTTSAVLRWTAPFDDKGVVRYEIGVLRGRAFEDAGDWADAEHRLDSSPLPPGSSETFGVAGLDAGTLYGFALRSFDGAGGTSPLSNFTSTVTLAPPAPVDSSAFRPDAIDDLSADEVHPRGARLHFRAPTPRGSHRRVVEYWLHRRWSPGGSVTTAGRSLDAVVEDSMLVQGHTPAEPGAPETLAIALDPETQYTLRVTGVDNRGARGARGASLSFATPAEPPPPPPSDEVPPGAITDLRLRSLTSRWATVAWTEVGDDGSSGRAARYVVGLVSGGRLESEQDWALADTTFEAPSPDSAGQTLEYDLWPLEPGLHYAVAVRARDEAGNLSPLGDGALPFETPVLPDSLPPHRIVDLRVAARSESTLTLAWTTPADSGNGDAVASAALRWSLAPLVSEFDWENGHPVPLGAPGNPGSAFSVVVEHLEAGQRYAVAVRSWDAAGNGSALSNVAVDSTLSPPTVEEPDDTPPAAIADLRVLERGPTFAELEWTATGDDSLDGQAAAYEFRYLIDEPLSGEAAWARAIPANGSLPTPAPPGTKQRLRFEPLLAASSYGIAIRAVDDDGNRSALPPASIVIAVYAPPEVPPPAPVQDLRLVAASVRSATLALRPPLRAEGGAAVVGYRVGVASVDFDEASWASVGKLDDLVPAGDPGSEEIFVVPGLLPATDYHVAVRSVDEDGRESALSPVLHFTTDEEDLAPPEPPSGINLSWASSGALVVTWSASGDPRTVGYHLYAQGSTATWVRLTDSYVTETQYRIEHPDPAAMRRFAVAAVTLEGDESSFVESAAPFAETFAVEGPFPHPVRDSARIRIELPFGIASGGSEGRVRIELLRVDGSRARRAELPPLAPGSVYDWDFDRKSDAGERLAPGYYFLRVIWATSTVQRTIYLAP